MTDKQPNAPAELQDPGQKLWTWATTQFDISGCEPLLAELCEIADRLARIRSELRAAPKIDARLVAAETKLTAQYSRVWRLLGLADSGEEKKRVGRPHEPLKRAI